MIAVLSVAVACSHSDPATGPKPPIPPPGNYYVIDESPAWSPDGQTIAYYRTVWTTDGPPGIYCISVEGTKPRLVLPDSTGGAGWLPLVQDIRFSPDASRLAVALYLEVLLVDIKDGGFERLTYTDGNARSPDWSPDGKWIVYSRPFRRSAEIDSAGIYVVDVISGSERALFHGGQPVVGGTPRWSPQGEPIVFWSGEGAENLDIFSVRSDGTDFRRLTFSGVSAESQYPRWAFGGTRLLYLWRLSSDANTLQTRVMYPDGTGQTTWPVNLFRSDAISPDSREFVYPRVPRGDSLVVLFVQGIDDAAETSLRQLTHYTPPPFPDSLATAPRFSAYSDFREELSDERFDRRR